MSSIATAVIILTCMLAGVLLGTLLRRLLPDHHTRDESKDVIKTAAGMLATLVALIIGLLVSSSKSTFDTTSAGITQGSAKLITLDRTLARYGPEAQGLRDEIKRTLAQGIERIWPSDHLNSTDMASFEKATGFEDIHDKIRDLTPKNDAQRTLQSQALQYSADLLHSRWLLIEQAQNTLPTVFLVVLVFWLTTLFTSFGLLAPRNVTAAVALFICALSMAGSLFLIMELNRPLEGTVKVSSAPMLKAYSLIGK